MLRGIGDIFVLVGSFFRVILEDAIDYIRLNTCAKIEVACLISTLVYCVCALVFINIMETDLGRFDETAEMAIQIVNYGDGWSKFFFGYGIAQIAWLAVMAIYMFGKAGIVGRHQSNDDHTFAAIMIFLFNAEAIALIVSLTWHSLILAFLIAVFGTGFVAHKAISASKLP